MTLLDVGSSPILLPTIKSIVSEVRLVRYGTPFGAENNVGSNPALRTE